MSELDSWVSQEFANLAQVINDYDQYLFLEMVPVAEHANLVDKSKVFRVVDDRTGNVVLYADSLAFPQQILARLWSMDQTKGSVINRLELENAATEALNLRKQLDEIEARKDLVAFIAKNTKSRWVHEGRVRDDEFRDLGPVSKAIV
jgi:hypothetical protein